MDQRIQGRVRSLKAQQVAVGSRLAPGPQIFIRALSHAERYGQWSLLLNASDDFRQPFGADSVILPGLQNHGAIAEFYAFVSAPQNFLATQAITLEVAVRSPEPAVTALAHA